MIVSLVYVAVLVYDNANRAHYDGWLRTMLYTETPEESALLSSMPI